VSGTAVCVATTGTGDRESLQGATKVRSPLCIDLGVDGGVWSALCFGRITPPNKPVPLCGSQGRSGRFGSRTTDRPAGYVVAVQTAMLNHIYFHSKHFYFSVSLFIFCEMLCSLWCLGGRNAHSIAFSSVKLPDPPWGPHSFLCNGYQGSFPGIK
jgi:hypothetical protein